MRLKGSANSSQTICFDFTRHGQLRDGETISAPEVYASPISQLVIGVPVVLSATFRDSNGKKIGIGKGVKVRVQGGNAGTEYTMVCRVHTSGGDVIEEPPSSDKPHTYLVGSSLP